MALGRCNACSNKLGFGSRTCDRCGAKKSRAKLIFGLVILMQAGTIVWWEYFHTKRPTGGMNFIAETTSSIVPPVAATPPAGWLYYDTRDDLVSDVTHHARVLSRGAARSGLLHDNSTNGVLEVRASTVYGRSAIITLQRDPFDTVADTCDLHAEFDSGDAMDLHASCAADGTKATVVIQDARILMQRLEASQTLLLDMKLSMKVERTAMFDVSGLKI